MTMVAAALITGAVFDIIALACLLYAHRENNRTQALLDAARAHDKVEIRVTSTHRLIRR